MNEKTASDYLSPPTSGLNFEEAFVYESDCVYSCAPGMIGSYSDNSFFIVTRELNNPGPFDQSERIVKFNLEDGSSTENIYSHTDLVSKQLHIVDNKLVVIGGQYVNTYNLDFSGDPTTTMHGKLLTRFGMAVQDDIAYIVGGDYNTDPNTNLPIDADKIFGWNLNTQTLSSIATMPAQRFGARSSIINNKLYVFGGTAEFDNYPAHNTIFIHDLESGTVETLNLPYEPDYTHVDKRENLIYVVGHIIIRDGDGFIQDRIVRFGVFNTTTNTYTDIDTNIDDNDTTSTIHGMCVFNNKMYMIYGNEDTMGTTYPQYSVMSADLE